MNQMPRWKRLSILAALVLAGCTQESSDSAVSVLPGDIAVPGGSYSFLTSFTQACGGAPVSWSIREQGLGWTALDGGITQAGVWTAPGCGSAWLGLQLHVDAKCPSGQTATAVIATVPETVSGVQIAYAVRTTPLPTCLFPDPTNLSGLPPGGSVQFYARVLTTCGEVVTPTPPAAWPSACL